MTSRVTLKQALLSARCGESPTVTTSEPESGAELVKHRQRFPSEYDPEFERSNHLEIVREQHARDSAAEVRFLVVMRDYDAVQLRALSEQLGGLPVVGRR